MVIFHRFLRPLLHLRRNYSQTLTFAETDLVSTSEMKKYFSDNDIKHQQGFTCLSLICPRVSRFKSKSEEAREIYVNMTTGYFTCNECGKSGSWSMLQDNITMFTTSVLSRKRKESVCFPELDIETNQFPVVSSTLSQILANKVSLKSISNDVLDDLLYRLGLADIPVEALMHYGIFTDSTHKPLYFPLSNDGRNIVALKKLLPNKEEASRKSPVESYYPKGEPNGLFGLTNVDSNSDELILTATELDALAIYHLTKLNAVSLPRGCTSLPQEVLPFLERYQKITLWLGIDMKSWESAKIFSKKLNDKRCYIIRPTNTSPNAFAAFQKNLNIAHILKSARLISHQSITSFTNLRLDVFHELANHEQVAGVKWQRYPTMNKLLKGHRRGELTVFTGPTGSGKTTFISDYSLDLCMQGVNTLWGSFEINNVRLMKMMLSQFSQINLSKKINTFNYWADKFEKLPMYFMKFHGQENMKKVIETMSHAVYVHDIAHVIVDNLQFMMGVNDRANTDKYQRQDMFVGLFRKFATTMNCHVTLIIHPRKERETDDLTTASIYGSAKCTQEADNVMILQDKRIIDPKGRKFIQITKNRFDGEVGVMLLKFDKNSLSFATSTKSKAKTDKDDKSKGVEDEES